MSYYRHIEVPSMTNVTCCDQNSRMIKGYKLLMLQFMNSFEFSFEKCLENKSKLCIS